MIIAPLLLAAVAASAQPGGSAQKAAAAAVPSCSDAKELETDFSMTLTFADGSKPVELKLVYAGCVEEGRNDYLPPYTERYYKGQDGYALTLVTEDGRDGSDVLLSKGADWVGRFSTISNATLVSGNDVAAGGVELKDASKGKAVLRKAPKVLYPQLLPCEAAVTKALGAALRDLAGKPVMGYQARPSLVLLTPTDAYYYHEDCDICAEVTRCELKAATVTSLIAAHSVSCADMAPYSKDAVYDACAPAR